MDDWVIRFRVGVVFIAAAIATIVLVMLFGQWPNLLRNRYEINVEFPEAPGITVETPVRKSGVLIGRVSEVTLQDKGVLVKANIDEGYKLRREEMCRIGSGSLLGDAVLEFVPMGMDDKIKRFDTNGNNLIDPDEQQLANELIGDGDYMTEGVVASNPMRILVNLEDDIMATLKSIQSAGDQVQTLAATVNNTVDGKDADLQDLLVKADRSLEQFQKTMETLQTVIGDPKLAQDLKTTLQSVPMLVNETRETMQVARTTFTEFQKVSSKAEQNLDNLAGFTEPLKERGPQLAENIERSSENLNQVLLQLVTFTETLNEGQGTLGKLVHDDELYQRIERIADNAEDITRRVRPIMEDVRVFTDKIARDPRQLGVKGALDRRPGGIKTATVPW